MSKVLIALSGLLMLVLTSSVKADPIVVTSGSLTVPGILRAPQYSFAGQNLSVTGAGSEFGAAPSCFPCKNGDQINLSSLFVGGSLGLGSLTVDGTTFDNLFFGGVFQFTGGTVIIPAAVTSISLTAPFIFSGNLAACPLEAGGPDCTASKQIFSAQFIGQGIATLQLRFSGFLANGDSLYDFQSITYNFDSAEIPEPMTVTLLAAGLIGLAVKRARGKRRDLG